MPFKKGEIDIISMGCSKNLIDSERLMKRLEDKKFKIYHNPDKVKGEYVVVNTCGFISDAKEESIDMILRLAELKNQNKIGSLIVMGCLSERYKKELPDEIPEVDKWYGKFDWKDFIDTLPTGRDELPLVSKEWERHLTTPPWSAYVKISEGCERYCAYCAIPMITGRYKSRPMEEIELEVKELVKKGVKEFNIIAQDLSSYGLDLYKKQRLPELIDLISRIEGVEWIRLHYLYPSDFPIGILEVMNNRNNVCKYIDIALQHISDKVLDNMNRHISKEETLKLLEQIREKVPGIHIRTTIMTGFPGEGENEYRELMDFVRHQEFERLGGFTYSEEDDTLAAKRFEDSVPHDTKQARLDELMNLQQEISYKINQSKIGETFKVLVDRQENGFSIGRTEFDSPEVDQEVIIENCDASPGSFTKVKITEAGPFDLKGIEIK